MLLTVALVTTSSTVLLVTPKKLAEILDPPSLNAVASPFRSMVATLISELFQLTWLVTSCDELSLKVAMAWNCSLAPLGRDAVGGMTCSAVAMALVTVRVALRLMAPRVAVTVA
ncbi:hypothetical protein D3C71_1347720 [compost metagenome]